MSLIKGCHVTVGNRYAILTHQIGARKSKHRILNTLTWWLKIYRRQLLLVIPVKQCTGKNRLNLGCHRSDWPLSECWRVTCVPCTRVTPGHDDKTGRQDRARLRAQLLHDRGQASQNVMPAVDGDCCYTAPCQTLSQTDVQGAFTAWVLFISWVAQKC